MADIVARTSTAEYVHTVLRPAFCSACEMICDQAHTTISAIHQSLLLVIGDSPKKKTIWFNNLLQCQKPLDSIRFTAAKVVTELWLSSYQL